MNISKLLVAASAVTVLCSAASAQEFSAEAIQLEGRMDSAVIFGGEEEDPDTAECNIIWENGLPDNAKAVRSAESPNGMHQYYAGDDFIYHPCRWNYIEAVELYMLIGDDVIDPLVELRIYPDCDGKPDKTQMPEVYPGFIGVGVPSVAPGFDGLNQHKIRFPIDKWVFGEESGCERFWLVPVGLTNNSKYYWISTDVGNNDQRVQGVQSHFKAPNTVPPYTDWTPYDEYCPNPAFPDCAGDCLDFNFRICGKICALLKDQSDYDLNGFAATKFPNVNDTGRSADNFQVAPGQGMAEICRIEAWMATNCNPDLVYGTIYDNYCDKPGPERLNLGFVDFWEATGDTFDGLPVYKFVWFCTGETVPKGRNYWFAPAASRGVNAGERSVWLFRERQEMCMDIWITEGCYVNWNDDEPAFEPVSNLTAGNVQYDFAMKLWLVDDDAGGSVPQGDPGETYDAADIDRNGSVGLEDLQLLLFRFGTSSTN